MIAKAPTAEAWTEAPETARLVLADGTVIRGYGLGATGRAVGPRLRPGGGQSLSGLGGYQQLAAAFARQPATMSRKTVEWRAIQNKTANSYAIEIAR